MRVLHLLRSSQFSGAENVACQIIQMMKAYPEFEMVYCSADGPIREALEERRIPHILLEKVTPKAVRSVIQSWKPDVIHAHDMYASTVAACVCGSIKLISHIHNNNFDSRGITAKAVIYRLAAMKAKHIFWVSRSAQQGYCFHKSLEKKSSVLYNVIDISQLEEKAARAENQTSYDVVYLGRLTYQKNPERLISVFARIIAGMPDVQVAIVGTGELEGEVQQQVEQWGLQHNVHCLGFMSNPYGILKNAKVMLMTSRWEGLPMCALEAQALGVPIVSTPTDGLKELIENGKDGFLSADDQGLVEGVLGVLNDEMLHRAMAGCAKEKAVQINNREDYTIRLKQYYT